MRRRRRVSAPFSFAFLDVFACTLGALIFVLVGCVLEGQRVTGDAELALAVDVEAARAQLEQEQAARDAREKEEGWRREFVGSNLERRRAAAAEAREELELLTRRREELELARADRLQEWGRLPTEVDDRTPVYLECRDETVTVQPQGLTEDRRELRAQGSRVRALLKSLSGDRRRYPVLILRSSGFLIYQELELLCSQLKVDYAREPLPDDLRIEGWQ